MPKMDAAQKAQISSELATASLLTTGQLFLRLGLATVIVVGNGLVMKGQTNGFDITFDHVKFSYEKGRSVLQDVSFTAKQGVRSQHWLGHPAAAKVRLRSWPPNFIRRKAEKFCWVEGILHRLILLC